MQPTRARLSLLLAVLGTLALPASAQQRTPDPVRVPPANPDVPQASYWFEDYEFSPDLNIGYQYDDNIYATETGELSDSVLLASAAATAQSKWERHAIKANAGAALARYAQYDAENTTDYWASASGRLDLADGGNLFATLGYTRDHEARGSIESVSGDEPTAYSKRSFNAGMRSAPDTFAMTVALNGDLYDYQNTPAAGGEIFNDDRDRLQSALGARVSYQWRADAQLLAQVTYDHRNYDLAVDDAGYQRDSSGYRVAGGISTRAGERFNLEMLVGYLTQTYDDPRFDKVSEPDFSAKLRWYVNPDAHLGVTVDRTLEETTVPGSSGYLYTQYGLRWNQRMTSVLFAKAWGSLGVAEYQQVAIEDDYRDLGVGLGHPLAKGVLLNADYRLLSRDSNQLGEDFDRNQFSFYLSARF